MVGSMWCYGITKEHLGVISKTSVNCRQPSDGLIKFQCPIPALGPDEVLVEVKASALNYNSIWSSLAFPVDPFSLISNFVKRNPSFIDHQQPFAVFGSDASGVVVKMGSKVADLNIGDEVVVHCNIVSPDDPVSQADAMLSPSQSIWGYETNYGAFAQYTKVNRNQLLRKPGSLSFTESASLMLTLSTAYRMLVSRNGANICAGQTVLIWGAAGGLGSYAVQLAKLSGCNVIAVVNGEKKRQHVLKLGADYALDRAEANLNGLVDEHGKPNYLAWAKAKRYFLKNNLPEIDVVFEHVGAATLGFSTYILKRGGKVVTCAASSGFNANVDLRYLWMELKSIVGSHFANNFEASKALELVEQGKVKPVIDSVNHISDLPIKMNDMFSGNVMGKIVFSHD